MTLVLDLFVAMPMPSWANSTMHWSGKAKREQQNIARRALDMELPKLPALQWPLAVRFTRRAKRPLDLEDNLSMSTKYVRDTVARFFKGLPETEPRRHKDGSVVVVRGKVKCTRPHAPDGEKDGYIWLPVEQELSRGRPDGVRIEVFESMGSG